jgi:uncharacterized DUF497 family protein
VRLAGVLEPRGAQPHKLTGGEAAREDAAPTAATFRRRSPEERGSRPHVGSGRFLDRARDFRPTGPTGRPLCTAPGWMRLTSYELELILEDVATVVYGDFEWDSVKAEANLAKHGISFAEAATAIADPRAKFFDDPTAGESRLVALGMSTRARVLCVVHVERWERDRIISARRATPAEEREYAKV